MKVKGIEKLTQEVGRFSWPEFKIVKQLIFSQIGGEATICLDMISDQRTPALKAKLLFSGVTKFNLEDFGGYETRLSGFDIRDIQDKGWEGVSWEVLDFEEEQIHFFAKEFEIMNAPKDTVF